MTTPKSSFRSIFFPLISAPILVIVAGLCVMNADDVVFTWWPLATSLELPLFLIMLALFALGFLVGALLTWLDKK